MGSSRKKKKEITKQKLIEAAIAEFAEVGYARANVSRISKRAGFASGTIYYYFRSKHELLIAVVEGGMDMLKQCIEEGIADIEDLIEKIRRSIELTFRFWQQNEQLSMVIVREGFAAGPEIQKEFLSAIASPSRAFAEILEQGKEEGLFRDDFDSAWSTIVMNGMVGYMLLARSILDDAGITYDEMSDLAIKCFVEGILPR